MVRCKAVLPLKDEGFECASRHDELCFILLYCRILGDFQHFVTYAPPMMVKKVHLSKEFIKYRYTGL